MVSCACCKETEPLLRVLVCARMLNRKGWRHPQHGRVRAVSGAGGVCLTQGPLPAQGVLVAAACRALTHRDAHVEVGDRVGGGAVVVHTRGVHTPDLGAPSEGSSRRSRRGMQAACATCDAGAPPQSIIHEAMWPSAHAIARTFMPPTRIHAAFSCT